MRVGLTTRRDPSTQAFWSSRVTSAGSLVALWGRWAASRAWLMA